jgi:hypothetical protein
MVLGWPVDQVATLRTMSPSRMARSSTLPIVNKNGCAVRGDHGRKSRVISSFTRSSSWARVNRCTGMAP